MTYICEVVFHVVSWWAGILGKYGMWVHHEHLSNGATVNSWIHKVIQQDNMASTDDETFAIKTWFIQGLPWPTIGCSAAMNLQIQ